MIAGITSTRQGRPSSLKQWSKPPPPVRISDDLALFRLWFFASPFLARMLHSYQTNPSVFFLLTGVWGITPENNFEIMLACRRFLAHFGQKNSVFDEPTKSPTLFFHRALAPGFTLCRAPGPRHELHGESMNVGSLYMVLLAT
jgi:hypothetical protein